MTVNQLPLTQDCFAIGITLSRQGNYQRAIESFDQALQLNPDDAEVYGYRCVARHKLGNQQGAIADCRHAIALYLAQGNTKGYQYALKMLGKLQQLM
jgi:Flp pilus assembly protein TadD